MKVLSESTGRIRADQSMEAPFIPEVLEDVLEYLFDRFLSNGVSFKELMDLLERRLLVRALIRFEGCQKKAGEFLDIKHTTLCAKCKRHRIRFIKLPQ